MATMERGKTSFFTEWKPKVPPQGQKKGKFQKGKPMKHSDEIVYSKGPIVQTMPSLSKQLEGNTSCVVGLQYVWEYRSPSLSVAPLYICKVCNVHQFQGHMLAHITGWKHAFRYIAKDHSDKITFTEEEVTKDPNLKKTVKEVAAELASSEGRGQLKVILKEPADVPAFKVLLSSVKRIQKEEGYGPPHQGGFRSEGFGGYASMPAPDYNRDRGNYYGHNPHRGEYEGYDQGGPSGDYHGYREGPMGPMNRMGPVNPMKRPRPNDGGGGDIPNTLLGYLDTFKIENENDAQLVLKVTQKLTDILMEYRLGSVPKVPSLPPFRPPPPKMPKYNEPYSGYQGPSRYSGPISRY